MVLSDGRHFQHYLMDQFGKMEVEKLPYLLRNQRRLRTENYAALRGLLGYSEGTNDELEAVRSGRLVFIPSTCISGEQYMRQKMHDIIETSNKMRHPDIFLTMTCSTNWPEIRSSLLPEQSPQARPDLCARVFNLKLKALMKAVIKGEVFGEVVSHVRVIEFQN